MRVLVVLAIVLASRAANADPYDASVSFDGRMGPVPNEYLFWSVDGLVGRTWWDRVRLGVRAGAGAGPNDTWSVEILGEAGVVLHPSQKLDLGIAYRFGHSWFGVQDMRVTAVAGEFAIDLRFRVGERGFVRFAPMVLASYWSNVWIAMIGPELGVGILW